MDAWLKTLHGWVSQSQGAVLLFVLLAAAAVFVFSLGVSALVLAKANPLRRRLGELAGTDRAATSGVAWIAERLQPISSHLLPSREVERTRVGRLLLHAGYRSPHALALFSSARWVLILTLPVLVLIASPLFPHLEGGKVMLLAIGAVIFGFLAPSVWLERRVESRQRELRSGFPDALDLLVVCVESGLGLAMALQRVADELIVSHPELGGELALVNAEMRAGVERSQALMNLAERTGLSDIRGLVALMVQTMRFGTSVADALRVYSEEFRDKRMQAAEEQAAKIGTKMIFPLIACMFPSFFLVAIGPAVLRLMDVFAQFGK
jgi:tight adherence protein C